MDGWVMVNNASNSNPNLSHHKFPYKVPICLILVLSLCLETVMVLLKKHASQWHSGPPCNWFNFSLMLSFALVCQIGCFPSMWWSTHLHCEDGAAVKQRKCRCVFILIDCSAVGVHPHYSLQVFSRIVFIILKSFYLLPLFCFIWSHLYLQNRPQSVMIHSMVSQWGSSPLSVRMHLYS